MSTSAIDWRVQACRLMSVAVILGFLAFAAYSFNAGVSKQAVYTGAVGYWLGMYLLLSGAVSVACVLLILWMAATRRRSWRQCAATFASAWLLTLLAYAAWHFLAQSKYLAAA
jgi:uncharacterized membrane protein